MLLGVRFMRRCCFFGIIICFIFYNFMELISDLVYTQHKITKSYFVNTSGCRILAMQPYNKELMPFWLKQIPDQCRNFTLLKDWSDYEHNYLMLNNETEALKYFNTTTLNTVKCQYFAIERRNDFDTKVVYNESFKLHSNMKLKIEPHADIVRVICKHKMIYYKKVHFFIRPPKPQNQDANESYPLSIMIVGIDSISHMHFLRSMPLTSSYVQQLPHVEFWGYNRVGLNSFPNLMPLLSGLSAEEIVASCMNLSFDQCKFIWKNYKAAGHLTSLGEDTTVISTFSYLKPGFNVQPTDYYLRTAMTDMWYNTRKSTLYKYYCNGERTYADVLWEFFFKLLPHLKARSFLSFFWWTQGVHDIFNYAKQWDQKFLDMLQHLEMEGILDNTLVLIMSDHGLRFGAYRETYAGMLEENQPVLIALYPQWLQEEYPLAIQNLKNNAKRLVTTYDMHVMLMDLLNLQNLADSNVANRSMQLNALGTLIPRGISPFLPIPEFRDCNMASIPSHFCQCHSLKHISIEDAKVKRAARLIVRYINQLLQGYEKCSYLSLYKLQQAYVWSREKDEHEFEIKLQLQTKPGFGEFEATVRYSGYSLALDGPITRINKYGNQSYCIKNYLLEMYCYCIDQQQNKN